MSIGPEQLLLSKEQVLKAEQRIDVSHPVIAILEAHEPEIAEINIGLDGIAKNGDQQKYVAEKFGSLADDVLSIGNFPLAPLDLVAIWSKAGEMFNNNYEYYALAQIVATSYAVQGTTNPAWFSFPRQELETHSLPTGVVEDKEGLRHIVNRLDEVGDSVNELEYYSSGVRGKNAIAITIELAMRTRNGDIEAQKELDTFLADTKERYSPTIGKIGENIANTLSGVYMRINDALSM